MRVSGLNWQGLMEQIHNSLPYCPEVTEDSFKYFRYPRRSVKVNLPVRMDNGEVRVFEGYRVLHSSARGAAIGGVRYREGVSRHECEVLAAITTLKAAVADLPLGGALGGVNVDPDTLSEHELEGLTRRYTSELIELIGPNEDVLAPDIGTNSQVMAWIFDAFNGSSGDEVNGVVVGKPISLGGSYGSKDAHGLSAAMSIKRVFEHDRKSIKGARIAVFGYGDVGSKAALELQKMGALIVGVTDQAGGAYASSGLDLDRLGEHRNKTGSVKDFGMNIDERELLELDADAIVLAYDFGTVNAGNAHTIRTGYLVEAANRAVLPEAERYLASKNIKVIPDLLASVGSIAVNYVEWVQSHTNFFWTPEEIEEVVVKHINKAIDDVLEETNKYGIDMRTAALALALRRIHTATVTRGVYP